jgi:hypothetical protein
VGNSRAEANKSTMYHAAGVTIQHVQDHSMRNLYRSRRSKPKTPKKRIPRDQFHDTHFSEIMHPQRERIRGATTTLVVVPCVLDDKGYAARPCKGEGGLDISRCPDVDLSGVCLYLGDRRMDQDIHNNGTRCLDDIR